jgi:pyruvate,water dikinase
MLFGDESALEPKKYKSVDEVMSELKTPLSPFKKLLISKFLLLWSRNGVGYRELSKDFMIWMNNKIRQVLWHLAQQMVTEGIIPEADLFFYLTLDEIEKLCNGERDALILLKARLRKRILPKMDKYKFEEFLKGPEMKPRNVC